MIPGGKMNSYVGSNVLNEHAEWISIPIVKRSGLQVILEKE